MNVMATVHVRLSLNFHVRREGLKRGSEVHC
jgi:hypothetical protein